jgi:outer membrane protein OmpA-like peptidoglycan-associated protein
MRQYAEATRRTASQASEQSEHALREAGRSGSLALGNVAFREADRYTVTFAFDSAELSEGARATLDDAVAAVATNRAYVADVYGYTDTIGDPVYNEFLSARRAENVLRYMLAGSHATLGRFARVGLGETDPVMNGAEEDHAAGRRVVVRILERTAPEGEMPPVQLSHRHVHDPEDASNRDHGRRTP